MLPVQGACQSSSKDRCEIFETQYGPRFTYDPVTTWFGPQPTKVVSQVQYKSMASPLKSFSQTRTSTSLQIHLHILFFVQADHLEIYAQPSPSKRIALRGPRTLSGSSPLPSSTPARSQLHSLGKHHEVTHTPYQIPAQARSQCEEERARVSPLR
jgi:hypothetical protein